MGWSPRAFLIGCLLLGSWAGAQQSKSWQYNNASGKWIEAQRRSAPAGPVQNPVLNRAEQLLDARRYEQAHDLLLNWLIKHPKAPDRDRGILLLAEEYFAHGDRVWCFFECDELLENFPDSKLFFPALELQYRVADAFLTGYKKRFLGFAIVSMEDTGIEMLFRIQERAPGSPIAERSLLRTADYYYRTSTFDLSADAYGAFLRIYPRSPQTARARLRQAYSNFAQFHGPAYDVTPLLDARAEFQEIQARSPDLAQEEGVQQFIDHIDGQLASKIRIDAEYYGRVGQPKASVFLYRTIIQRYPNSKDAAVARRVLDKMPAWTLRGAWPPITAGQIPLPTTRPTLGP